jgi:hypothetical protein
MRYICPKQSAGKLKDLTRITCTLLAFTTEEGGAGMSTVKTYYPQVPLWIAMKNIELHQRIAGSEESGGEQKLTSKTNRLARSSAGKGAERVQSMSN